MSILLQAAGEFVATPVGKLLVAIAGLAVVVLVGRFVLNMAWRLLRIAAVVIGVLWLISVVAPEALARLGL